MADEINWDELSRQWQQQQAAEPEAGSGATEGLTGKRLDELRGALLTSDALGTIPAAEPVIDGLLYRDSLAWLHGKPGHGKSFVAIDWAGCVSTGLPWQMRGVAQGGVLYVIAEGTPGLRPRVRAWESRAGCMMPAKFLPVPVQLGSAVDAEAIAMLAAELQPALVVIDTQARVSVGLDENSAKDMGLLVAAADKIRTATRACVLLLHHEARGGENMRGSTSLEGAASTIIRVTKEGSYVTLTNPKQKDAPEAETIGLRLVPHLESAVLWSHDTVGLIAEMTPNETTVLNALRDVFGTTGASNARLEGACELNHSSFQRALSALVKRGRVVNTGTKYRSHYELAAGSQAD